MTDFIARLKSKDQNAFNQLYSDYYGTLYSRIKKMTGDKLCAEDILQDAFVKAWTGIERFDQSKASLFTWLVSICRNEVVDQFRNRNSVKRKITGNYIRYLEVNCTNSPGNKVDARMFLAGLEQRDRMLMDLIYFHGYSYSQTSELMSMPLGSVKTKVRKLLCKWRAN